MYRLNDLAAFGNKGLFIMDEEVLPIREGVHALPVVSLIPAVNGTGIRIAEAKIGSTLGIIRGSKIEYSYYTSSY